MNFIKISYGSPKRYIFVPADGQKHNVLGLDINACQNDDGSYTINTFDFERKQPNNVASELVPVDNSYVAPVGKQIWASYCTIDWDYLHGCRNSTESFCVTIVCEDVALAEGDDVTKATIFVERDEYQKALELVKGNLDADVFYRVNNNAHRLMAKMLEYGLGVEKNLDKAFVHYLYAKSFEDIARFLQLGFGKGVLDDAEPYWDEYHALLLLAAVGESNYAYNRMVNNASNWYYKDEEKTSTRADYLHKHKFVALSRKQACLWAMERGDYKFGGSEKFTLFAGAYLSCLSQGHEGACSYETDNGGGSKGQHTSVSIAERWLDRGVQDGNEFAIKAKAFIQKSREQQ